MKSPFKAVVAYFRGIRNEQEWSEEERKELQRVHRRLTKFPRLKGGVNPMAMRTALFKERYNLNPEPPSPAK